MHNISYKARFITKSIETIEQMAIKQNNSSINNILPNQILHFYNNYNS